MNYSHTLASAIFTLAGVTLFFGGRSNGFLVTCRRSLGRSFLLPLRDTTKTGITDWVVENLESGNSSITSKSTVKAGENDTLPETGLCIGKVRILASDSNNPYGDTTNHDPLIPIRLLVGRNGWGTGVHPTTRLCLEWVCDTIQGGEVVLDYGCGSGILSIAALQLGAARCIGVDIEAEALVTAQRNVILNELSEERFEPLHTREVLPYGITAAGVDVCVANILIGQLARPSMVAAILSNLAPNGLLCLSGIRPDEILSLKTAYGDSVEWLNDQCEALSAVDTEGSISSYGFDCGIWSRVVGRKKTGSRDDDIQTMSELAVS
jgi:2-polyprenyl-3-methyl-5-hydroxy-6-metoxy-1,4-benzoquinol methylase